MGGLLPVIRKQPCYWASPFTAAEATEQGCYLMPLLPRATVLLFLAT